MRKAMQHKLQDASMDLMSACDLKNGVNCMQQLILAALNTAFERLLRGRLQSVDQITSFTSKRQGLGRTEVT